MSDILGVTGPRLFVIPARDAPVAVVLRRGPTAWSHVGRWDLTDGTYEAGSWIKANLYPQRCDLSPDGQWLVYFTARGPGTWDAGSTYIAVSKAPWLTALAAWGTCGTWTRGAHFADDPSVQELGVPDEGDLGDLVQRYGLAFNRATTFAVERRRGWAETASTPVRADHDVWDELRADDVVMEKRRPGGHEVLSARGRFAAFREGPFPGEARVTDYRLVDGARDLALDGAQWADWTGDGRLLVATVDGHLQIRDGDAREVVEAARAVHDVDLSTMQPDPQRPPAAARRR
ncbi:MAG: hypothetical protein ABW033_07355 [Acidimicrobiia bacterium]